MKSAFYLLISLVAAQKPGFITTMTSDFLKQYTGDIMAVFEETCQDLDIPDQKFSFDMELLMATMNVQNQVLTEFKLDRDKSKIEIVENEDYKYISVQVEDMSMNFAMDFNIRSRPEWLRDDGKCSVSILNFDAAIHLVPYNNEGKV